MAYIHNYLYVDKQTLGKLVKRCKSSVSSVLQRRGFEAINNNIINENIDDMIKNVLSDKKWGCYKQQAAPLNMSLAEENQVQGFPFESTFTIQAVQINPRYAEFVAKINFCLHTDSKVLGDFSNRFWGLSDAEKDKFIDEI